MFFPFFLLGLGLPYAVLAALRLDIDGATECEPAFVSFRGELNASFHQVPLTLQILPLNATPYFVPLPSYAANSSGVNLSFLPVPANTEFMVALSSPSGLILSLVSDIFVVKAGTSQTCLPPTNNNPTFQLQDAADISQCRDFSMSIPAGSKPPLVQLFNPRGFGYPLSLTAHTTTTATYNMLAVRQTQVMLSFISTDGGSNQTTLLLAGKKFTFLLLQPPSNPTVQGDSSSPSNCFPTFNSNATNETSTAKPSLVSKAAIVGLSVGLGVTVLLAIPMAWLAIRQRRRRKQAANRINFDASRMEEKSYPSYIPYVPPVEEKKPPLPPPFLGYPGYSEGTVVKDPPYVTEKYSPTVSDYPRTSISWEYVGRDKQKHRTIPDPRISVQTTMLSSSNIEKMLNMARNRASEDVFANELVHSPGSIRSIEKDGYISTPPALHHHLSLGDRRHETPDVPHNASFFAEGTSMPLTESPESMGSLLRPDSDPGISAEALQGFDIMQPPKAHLAQEPIQRVASPRTIPREYSLAKLEKGSRRTTSNVSRFSLDSVDTGGYAEGGI
ncbi:hypothetical protein D9757_003405 [Collybiopsis confluens]|uniref:Uncharacterized protein n=1 Tax=Collybiopsis confluens TaxID=2823264 RepID=A0A8H5MCU4_9AGAR|nr:hypothetical protein D9757_003405 [Collybiopsis confluens]